MRFLLLGTLIIGSSILGIPAWAESPVSGRPTVIVEPNVQVNGTTITLGEIAQISAATAGDKSVVERLRSLSLGEAPIAGSTRTIPGDSILEMLRSHEIDLQDIGYSIPHEITVSRASRVISTEEILNAARNALPRGADVEIKLRAVQFSESPKVPIGPISFKIQQLGTPANGKLPLRVEAVVNGNIEGRFLATADVDYWQTVAVIKRPLDRGMMISPEDLDLVKLNLTGETDDLISSVQDAVGQKAKQRLSAGVPLRRSQIDYPPMIARGARISIKYRDGILEATAAGIAVADGREGDTIAVQNEGSKKVVKGRIVSSELVEVITQ